MRAALLTILMVTIVVGPADVWAAQKSVSSEVEARALKEMASAIPLGTRVRIQTTSGRRVNGTLMSVTDAEVIIKKTTRLAEPAVTVPFAELSAIERESSKGMSLAKAIGFGLAAGAAAILTMIGIVAVAFD